MVSVLLGFDWPNVNIKITILNTNEIQFNTNEADMQRLYQR